MRAIRGAICADNTAEDISARAVELVTQIMRRNMLTTEQVNAVIFSATADLDACYPAAAVRETLALDKAALMCLQEMNVSGSLDHCIRVCVLAEGLTQSECIHCYLGRAAALRSDLD